ncbi:MAG: integrin alpha [Planctomycetota bacterium]
MSHSLRSSTGAVSLQAGRLPLFTAAAAVIVATSASAQQDPLLFQRGSVAYAEFASDVQPFGDLDGDGRDDLLVSAPSSFAGFPGQGHVQIVAGDSGRVLLTRTDFGSRRTFGHSVASMGDVDGDGTGDFAVGALQRASDPTVDSRVAVYSGATGDRIWFVGDFTPNERLGFAMDSVGDQNGDGVRDLLVGAPAASVAAPFAGAVLVLSGTDGAVLRRIDGSSEAEQLGTTVSRLDDVNGDGVEDFLVGAPGSEGTAGSEGGEVRLLSGANGGLLRRVRGRRAFAGVGTNCDDVGDVDGDGISDFLMNSGSSNPNVAFGQIAVVSSATGGVLMTVAAPEGVRLSRRAAGIGDADGDGRPDIAFGLFEDPGPDGVSRIRVVDAATGDLVFESRNLLRPVGGFIRVVARAGDGDRDGGADVACAVPAFSRNAPRAGALLVFGLPR